MAANLQPFRKLGHGSPFRFATIPHGRAHTQAEPLVSIGFVRSFGRSSVDFILGNGGKNWKKIELQAGGPQIPK